MFHLTGFKIIAQKAHFRLLAQRYKLFIRFLKILSSVNFKLFAKGFVFKLQKNCTPIQNKMKPIQGDAKLSRNFYSFSEIVRITFLTTISL